MRINGIPPRMSLQAQENFLQPGTTKKAVPAFKDTLSKFLKDVNDAQKTSGETKRKLLTGETTDVHQVMNKSEEANVAFNMLMELRNKTIDGYNEITRLRL